jgi:two-component system response regulator AtoC
LSEGNIVSAEQQRVLVVDDRLEWLLKCADILTEEGYDVATCRDAEKAMDVFQDYKPDAVLLDIKMPRRNGLEVLKSIRSVDPWVVVIMLSGYGGVEKTVSAMKLRADNFIDKDSDLRKIPLVIEKEIRSKRLEIDNIRLRAQQEGGRVVLLRDIIGECPRMRQVKEEIRTYADSKEEVLLTGPTGVGKDHVAMALHYESHRRNEPFVNVRCPQLPVSLIESELFGYERGAFTGAYKSRDGLIQAARKGTVLLNEFVEIPTYLQAKFLGVLDLGLFNTLGGGGKDRKTYARFIAATNLDLADLNAALDDKRLRDDLLWRLKKIWIRIPPLKDRGEDIILLAEHFVADECRNTSKPVFSLSKRSKDVLMNYHWPGNVRQLEGCMRVMVQSGRQEITEPPRSFLDDPAGPLEDGNGMKLRDKLRRVEEDCEKTEIDRALRLCAGSRKKAATELGISYRALLYKMKKYGLRDRF